MDGKQVWAGEEAQLALHRPSNTATVPSIPKLVPSSARRQIPSSSLHVPCSPSSHTPSHGPRSRPTERYRNNSMPRNTNRRFNLIPTKAGISRARTSKSTHAALPWQDEPWLLPHGAAQGKTCAPPTPNPPKACICQENPKLPGKAVLVSPERHSRHKWHLHPPGTPGHQLPGGHGTRNLLLSSLDSNSGPVPSAKPQCNPPGNSVLTRTGSSVANSMRSFPSSCLTGASSSCTC